MDTRLALGRICWKPDSKNRNGSNFSFSFAPYCSRKDSPRQSGDNDSSDKNGGDKFSTDWDKAWTKFKKQGKKTLFSQFSPDKYVSWNPRRSDFPISEEVDPIKRTERSNLKFWNSPTFTLGGAIIIVLILLLYTLSAPIPK